MKKFSKLKLKAQTKQKPDGVGEIAAEDGIMEDLRAELELVEQFTSNLHQATAAFARALDQLNTVNARFGRGPVDIEDELMHHCFAQETLNQRYAAANAGYRSQLDQAQPSRER